MVLHILHLSPCIYSIPRMKENGSGAQSGHEPKRGRLMWSWGFYGTEKTLWGIRSCMLISRSTVIRRKQKKKNGGEKLLPVSTMTGWRQVLSIFLKDKVYTNDKNKGNMDYIHYRAWTAGIPRLVLRGLMSRNKLREWCDRGTAVPLGYKLRGPSLAAKIESSSCKVAVAFSGTIFADSLLVEAFLLADAFGAGAPLLR